MKRFALLLAVLIIVTALAVGLIARLQAFSPVPAEVRAIWVTRFDYTSPEDVRRIIGNVAEAGFTDVFFQVRGNGTAFYPSQLEPRAYELSGDRVELLGTDPGWDPLQLAIDQAKPSGLRVHAYINVLPGWKGTEDPPEDQHQLWTAHPEWFMVDSTGEKMRPTSGWYAFINPVLPDVRQHLRGIAEEVCRYDIAGVHLDYIRYPYDYHLVADQHYPDASRDELLRHADFSYDEASQAALFNRYGWGISRQEVTQFRCESVTRVVRDIAYVVQLHRPGGVLSAAVLGNPLEGRTHAYQDSVLWARSGLINWAVQMNYGTKSFEPNLDRMRKAVGGHVFRRSVVVGINGGNSEEDLIRQLDTIRESDARGVAVFSYTHLFDAQHELTEKGRTLLQHIRPQGN